MLLPVPLFGAFAVVDDDEHVLPASNTNGENSYDSDHEVRVVGGGDIDDRGGGARRC